jgi:hypothetical protein
LTIRETAKVHVSNKTGLRKIIRKWTGVLVEHMYLLCRTIETSTHPAVTSYQVIIRDYERISKLVIHRITSSRNLVFREKIW